MHSPVRGNATLFNYENKRPNLDDLLTGHHNLAKWYHKNGIYELATIKNSIDTIEHNETVLTSILKRTDSSLHLAVS